ncbi:MAG: aminoacyl-histidine dipeptidase [Bacteroidetes bacterium]|nr:aminoacyl-histidine dipeptidase [Bacteroidota bacterium]
MNEELLKLEPRRLWYYFTEILKIPRPSKKEEKIINYLLRFGKDHQLETLQDEIGNVLIRKSATPGMENRKMVVLQSHVDMVCEKNSDVDFDFDNDPIQSRIEDGWVKASGTTLGADDGIGIAAQLAILEAKDIEHGPIECLFTIDEETGLTGAFGLKPGFLKGKILLNLDSEDDGELFIGCAGGIDTVASFMLQKADVPDDHEHFRLHVKGLLGGHSGDDISKGRGNANKILNRMLWHGMNQWELKIAYIDAGNLRNAIAREAFAIVSMPSEDIENFKQYIKEFTKHVKAEFKITEPDLSIALESTDKPDFLLDKTLQYKLINAIYACPHGVIAWSAEIPNFVETSTNLASIKFEKDRILVTTSQRSSVESAKRDIANMVASVFNLAEAEVKHSDGYPGWTPNPHSEIVEITRQEYTRLFNEDPKVLAIHAGLECGLIGDVYPEMDMISYGPTIKGAHSPDERLKIDTVDKFWKLTLEVLKKIPAVN